jgi:hypothetical protein
MCKLKPILLGLSLAVAGSSLAVAQEPASAPKILQITREFIKPYKNGMAHDKTESAFTAAMTKAKFPAYYLGLDSMSGKERALFFTWYTSFEEWEADNKIIAKNSTLAGELEHASVADGDLLDSVDQGVFRFNPDMSYKPRLDVSFARYVEVTEFHVKAGHGRDWEKIVKMVKDAHDKAGTSAHWGMYEIAYGAEDGTYLVLSGHKSMSEIDTGFGESKKFADAIGQDGMKKLDELFGNTVDYSRSELFSVNPKQSYVSEDWIKSDPAFWKPKAAASAAKAAATAKKTTP